jgi:hypothetical protein
MMRRIGWHLVAILVCWIFFWMFLTEVAKPQPSLIVTVKNMGAGMNLVTGPYTGNPEGITKSINMFSIQPNVRQVRYGISETILYDSLRVSVDTAADGSTPPIDEIGIYTPKNDSSAIIFAAGGKWYWTYFGVRKSGIWHGVLDTITGAREIRPFNAGDSVVYAGDSLRGYATRFMRDLRPGDSVTLADSTRAVLHVLSDELAIMTAAWGLTIDTTTAWRYTRTYPDLIDVWPFIFQSDDLVYTGTQQIEPQVIYPKDDLLFMRHLGISDSMTVDAVLYQFGTDSTALVRSVDTASNDSPYVAIMQVVDRAQTWIPDQWFVAETAGGTAPEAFYFVFGASPRRSVYRILGNTDTSLFLSVVLVDSITNADWLGGYAYVWPDDTLLNVVGTQGYIYSATGLLREVVTERETTQPLLIYGGGGVFATTNTLPSPDSLSSMGMLFLRALDREVVFEPRRSDFKYYIWKQPCDQPPPIFPEGVVILGWTDEIEVCVVDGLETTCCVRHYTILYYDTEVGEPGVPSTPRRHITPGQAVFPILNATKVGDTTYIRTSFSFDPAGDTALIQNWDIVQAAMPRFSGMTEFNNELIAWGDSINGAIMSRSLPNQHWIWSGLNDVLVGPDLSDPIIVAFPFENLVFVMKQRGIVGWPGFIEISQGHGLVGPRAYNVYDKQLAWVDEAGPFMLSRREFNAWRIDPIGAALAPAFNSWVGIEHGTDVVPFSINPDRRKAMVLEFNPRDDHYWLFFASGSSSENDRALTMKASTFEWDGLMTIRASAALHGVLRDTSRIFIGSPDSAALYQLDYAYSDLGVGIDIDVLSHQFQLVNEEGEPIRTELKTVRLFYRAILNAFDSLRVEIINDVGGVQQFFLTPAGGGLNDQWDVFTQTDAFVSDNWRWRLVGNGVNTAQVFKSFKLVMGFAPFERRY